VEEQAGWHVWTRDQEFQIKWPVVVDLFEVVNPSRTGSFLRENTDLFAALFEGRAKLGALFGETTPVRLEFEQDPELPERRYLCARAVTGVSVPQAIARMDRFDEEWWLDRIRTYGRRLVFIVEFL
jgi:hypothetical protein